MSMRACELPLGLGTTEPSKARSRLSRYGHPTVLPRPGRSEAGVASHYRAHARALDDHSVVGVDVGHRSHCYLDHRTRQHARGDVVDHGQDQPQRSEGGRVPGGTCTLTLDGVDKRLRQALHRDGVRTLLEQYDGAAVERTRAHLGPDLSEKVIVRTRAFAEHFSTDVGAHEIDGFQRERLHVRSRCIGTDVHDDVDAAEVRRPRVLGRQALERVDRGLAVPAERDFTSIYEPMLDTDGVVADHTHTNVGLVAAFDIFDVLVQIEIDKNARDGETFVLFPVVEIGRLVPQFDHAVSQRYSVDSKSENTVVTLVASRRSDKFPKNVVCLAVCVFSLVRLSRQWSRTLSSCDGRIVQWFGVRERVPVGGRFRRWQRQKRGARFRVVPRRHEVA